jgi:hypothetical protein
MATAADDHDIKGRSHRAETPNWNKRALAELTSLLDRPPAAPSGLALRPPTLRTARVRTAVTRRELTVVFVVLVAALALRAPALRGPLLEHHGFRQTQTAYQAVEFQRHGIDLGHPRLPVLGPPYEVPFELPVFQAVATVPMNIGIDADTSMRITALFFFALTAIFLFGLLRHVANRVVAFASLLAFLCSPFGLVWSRASLMEYLATAAALGFLWAGIVWRDTRVVRYAVLATVALSIALAVKITSVFWVAPFVLYRSKDERSGTKDSGTREWIRARLSARVVVPITVALLAGFAWTRHADSIKSSSPATRWLTSSALQTWNFGTLDQRLDPAHWSTVINRASDLLVGGYLWIALILVALFAIRRDTRTRGFWIGITVAAVLPVTVFFNLYVVHDYYLASISPALAALLGLAASWVWTHATRFVSPRAVAVTLVALWLVPITVATRGYWEPLFDGVAREPRAAAVIASMTTQQDPVVVEGSDWDPSILYYARRTGLMLDPRIATPEVARLLHRSGYHHWYTVDPSNRPNDLLRTWQWFAPTGQHTFRMADTPAALRGEAVVATRDWSAIARMARSAPELSPVRTLACDGRTQLSAPAGQAGTLLVLGGADRDGVRISVRDARAALPGARAIFVAREGRAAGSTVGIRCTGPGSVRVQALDAASPVDA